MMMAKTGRPVRILMADDDPDDRMMIDQALQQSAPMSVVFVHDGQELMDFLLHRGPYADALQSPLPDLILLDLNMPRKDGREALAEIKSTPGLRHIPVVILTTSRSEEDMLRAYDTGANSCITKPASFQKLVDAMRVLTTYWFEVVNLP